MHDQNSEVHSKVKLVGFFTLLILPAFVQLSFEVGILAIFGNLEPHYKEELRKNYILVDKGYNSFPTNLPGTRYREAMKVRITPNFT